jgi:hypothetical protein
MPEIANSAMMHAPTVRERFWRALGFRYRLGDEPEGIEKMKGWMQTRSRIDFSLLDRLRLLLTGRLSIILTQHTDSEVASCVNRLDFQIKAPGDR